MKLKNQTLAACEMLPEMCYAVRDCNPPGQRVVVVRVGYPGFEATRFDCEGMETQEVQAVVDRLNTKMGITPTQQEALLAGVQYGWNMLGLREGSCVLH